MKNKEDIKPEKVKFSAHCCFLFDNGIEDKRCLNLLASHLISKSPGLAVYIYGEGKFFHYLLNHFPNLKSYIEFIIADDTSLSGPEIKGIPVILPEELPNKVKTVFLSETLTFPRMQMRKKINKKIKIVTPDVLTDLDFQAIPIRGWIPFTENIYQEIFNLPEIIFLPEQDMILIDCPSRNLSLMPNGLAYVHNALQKTGIRFQTVDLDIIIYHRYHIYRLFDTCGKVVTPGGKEMGDDPWMAEKMGVWGESDFLDFFQPEIDEIINGLVKARPKIIGLSIQQCNTKFSSRIVAGVKKYLPDTMILVGGYSCYFPYIGLNAFPESDYMIIGEADLIAGDLVKKLAAGERPKDLPGAMSRFDSPDREFVPGPIPLDLDSLEFPKYDWIDLGFYRNYSHYRLTPILGSRGCNWGKCRFCGEARFWRGRDPKKVADELEWLYDHGCDLFVFNDSDMNGDPELLKEICREVIRRRLKVRLSGQLKIDKRNNREFLDILRQAGFISLRFGVDGWSDHALKLQNKGYNVRLVSQNLRDCWEAGIPVEVNAVVGVPMETDDDIRESIELMLENQKYIWRLANINPLVMITGSIYWGDPEKYNIHFRGDKEEIYKKNLFHIPEDLWYSTEPYIDQNVRIERCKRILRELKESDFDFGPGAEPKVEDYLESMNKVEGEQKEKRSEPLTGAKTKGDAGKATYLPEQSFLIIKNNNEYYRINTNGYHGFDMLLAKNKLYSVLEMIFRKGMDIVNDRSARKVYLKKIKNRLYSAYRDRSLRQLIFIIHQYLMILQNRYSDPLSFAKPTPPMSMIKESFHNYNIIKVRSDYYAVKHGYPFNIYKYEAGMYEEGVCFMAQRVKDLEEMVEAYCDKNAAQRLIKEGYHGYNIIEFGNRIYGIKHGCYFNKADADNHKCEKGIYFRGESVEDVEKLISDYVSGLHV